MKSLAAVFFSVQKKPTNYVKLALPLFCGGWGGGVETCVEGPAAFVGVFRQPPTLP